MAWIKLESNKIIGFASNAKPTAEIGQWVERDENDPEVQEYLNPPEEKKANWAQFRAQMGMHGAYLRIATASPINGVLNSTLVWLLGEIGNNPSSTILGDVVNTWNAMALSVPPTVLEVTALNSIGKACNMPFILNSQGMMVLI